MSSNINPKADACSYVLIMLLQRLEKSQPGLLHEMIAGVEGDRSALPADVPNGENIHAVFDETLAMLKLANAA